MRAYKLLLATLLLVILLSIAIEGTVFDVLTRLWDDIQLRVVV